MKYFLIFLLLIPQMASAAKKRDIQEVNYFASLRSSETNVRSGPSTKYPIKFTFKLKGIPIHVINEYDNWSEIKDFDGQNGWVANSLITKKRTLIIRTTKKFITMHRKNNATSNIIYRLENNVIGDYLKCATNWCGIKIGKKRGWVKKSHLFGYDK